MDTRETKYQARSTKQSTITSDGGRHDDERKLPVMIGHHSPIEAGLLVVFLACVLIERNGGGRLPGTWVLTLARQKQGEWALTRDTTVYAAAAVPSPAHAKIPVPQSAKL